MKKYLILIILSLIIVNPVFATITFDVDGKWETTFKPSGETGNCDENDQFSGAGWPNCDELDNGGNNFFFRQYILDKSTNLWTQSADPGAPNEWYYSGSVLEGERSARELFIQGVRQSGGASYPGIPYTGVIGSLTEGYGKWGANVLDSLANDTWYIYRTSDPDTDATLSANDIYTFLSRFVIDSGDYVSKINSESNNPAGDADSNGYYCPHGGGVTIGGGALSSAFASPLTEFSLRFYVKFDAGYNWGEISSGNYPFSNKGIYAWTGGSNAFVCGFSGVEYHVGAANTPDSLPASTTGNGGWDAHPPGTWIEVEVQVKMDTDHTDGVAILIMDGVLVEANYSVDWSGSDNTPEEVALARLGWEYFLVGSNQGITDNDDSVLGQRFDDIVVYNRITTLPSSCDDGSGGEIDCIGPIGSTPTPTPTTSIKGATVKRAILK